MYPPSKNVIIAQCPKRGGPHPIFGVRHSISSLRMDTLFPEWRDYAFGVNAWWFADDIEKGRPSYIPRILKETGCTTVVALGKIVQRELGLPPSSEPISEVMLPSGIMVLRFPHPSGLSRYWNSAKNRREASRALIEVLTA